VARYKTIIDMGRAGFPVTVDDAVLSSEQFDVLARYYTEVETAGEDNPMEAAIERFSREFVVNGQVWVPRTKKYVQTATYESEDKILFRPGTWNGDKYSEADCLKMVANFDALSDDWTPPITLGHDDKQAVAKALGLTFDSDGMPAFGRIVKMWWDKTQKAVMARLGDLTETVKDLIDGKHYDKVSVVLAPQFEDERTGKVLRNVVVELALLGADIPGMMAQEDVLAVKPHTMAFRGKKIDVVTVQFDAERGSQAMDKNTQEKLDAALTELEQIKASIAKLYAKMEVESVDAVVEAFAKLTTERDDATKRADDLQEKFDKQADEAKETRIDSVLSEVSGDSDAGGRVLPQHAGREKALAMRLDTTTVIKFSKADGKEAEGSEIDEWEENIRARAKVLNFKELAKAEGDPKDKDKDDKDKSGKKEYGKAGLKILDGLGVSVDDAREHGQSAVIGDFADLPTEEDDGKTDDGDKK